MTTNEFFENILGRINLKIDDTERKNIEKKHNKLREALREKLPLKDDFLTGSYARHTLIKPKSGNNKFDVDIFVAFDNEHYGQKELSDLRQMVYKALLDIKDQRPDLGITHVNDSQRRSICVEFGTDFTMDIVPAIEIEKDVLYKIFDKKTLKALKSNPKLHARLLPEANERTGGKLVPIIKILKSWKREKCDYVKSFHLELLAVTILGGAEIASYAEGIQKFFNEAGSKLKKACLTDPANNQHFIDAYLDDDGKRQDVLDTVQKESVIANEAMAIDESKEKSILEKWSLIFEDDELDTARAINSGSFFSSKGGIQVGANSTNHAEPISSPRSWRNQ